MAENQVQHLLGKIFAAPGREEWKLAASSELDGADPFTALAWKTDDQIIVGPYYDRQDVAQLRYVDAFSLPAVDADVAGSRRWLNLPIVSVTDSSTANTSALHHLTNGADGILFDMRQLDRPDLLKLLQQIEWPYCSLSFRCAKSHDFVFSLKNYWSTLKDLDSITGAIFWDISPKKNDVNFFIDTAKNFSALGIVVHPATPVKEIAGSLLSAVKLIDAYADHTTLGKIIRAIAFSVPASQHFLEQISKLQALRMLWFQIVQAYGVTDYLPEHLHIHVQCMPWINERYQPHGNMLMGTAAAMSSVIGGCNSLTVQPEDGNNPMMSRIARNISNILREESHFDKVANAGAGAYVLDTLTDQMAQAAWKMFQETLTQP